MDDEELNNRLMQWGSQKIGQGRGRGCRSSAGHKAIGKEKKRKESMRMSWMKIVGRCELIIIIEDSDLKVVVKFKEGNDISAIGLAHLTNGLKKACGDIEMAKVLRDRKQRRTKGNQGSHCQSR